MSDPEFWVRELRDISDVAVPQVRFFLPFAPNYDRGRAIDFAKTRVVGDAAKLVILHLGPRGVLVSQYEVSGEDWQHAEEALAEEARQAQLLYSEEAERAVEDEAGAIGDMKQRRTDNSPLTTLETMIFGTDLPPKERSIFDGPFWTLAMTAAWIVWRDERAVCLYSNECRAIREWIPPPSEITYEVIPTKLVKFRGAPDEDAPPTSSRMGMSCA